MVLNRTSPGRAGGRIPELDALRGVAALAVVLYHLVGGHLDVEGRSPLAALLVRLGAYGVQLFFIISGFVILMTVENKARPRDFVVARCARLYPTYWAAVLLASALSATGAVPNHPVTLSQVIVNLTMLQHFFKVEDVDGAYWTLARELAFYVFMFLVMVLGLVRRIEVVCAVWLGVCFAHALAGRAGLVGFHARVETVMMVRTFHLLVAGMMFHRLRSAGHAWSRHLLIGLAPIYELLRGTGESLVVVVVLLAVFHALVHDRLRSIAVAPLVFLGSVSYALYAVHESAGTAAVLALHRLGLGARAAEAIAILACIGLAWAITAGLARAGRRRGPRDGRRNAP
jgi:peptidoglycan/LPS O-acetylase OafA/YrhL